MARIRVKDVREAIEGMPDDAAVELDMADPPDGYAFGIDGVGNYGGTLQISVSDRDDEDDEDDEDADEVAVPGGVMEWDDLDGTIRFRDDHGNTEGVWRFGEPEYEEKRAAHFPNHLGPLDDDDEDDDEEEEEKHGDKTYEVTFKAVVTATDEMDAADEARDTISHDDYDPTEVRRLED